MSLRRISLGIILILFMASSVISLLPHQASAAFDKTNIMDDNVFDDSGTMSGNQIQSFLNGFPNSCLKNYKAAYPQNYFNYGSKVSAATVIRRAASLWGINPRVILATLEKEEGLVTGGSGCASWRYNSAMGMGCPDNGACPAPEYAGFSKQVTKGSWQLKFSKERAYGNLNWDGDGNVYYYGYMTRGNRSRQSGQPTQYYDGYATIDGQSVYMRNGATAALYTYTPHFHGNQNFVTIFNQWFGSTYGSYFLRSTSSPTVYLVTTYTDSNDNTYNYKYPVNRMDTVHALSRLGGVKFVSQSLINSYTTQPALKRLIKSSDSSTVYFFDANIKLPFSSCTLIQDYDMTCGDVATLNQAQIDALHTGPAMTDVMKTTNGHFFKAEDGNKREVFDQTSLTQSGDNSSANTLSDSVLNYMPYGQPIIRNNVIAKSRSSGKKYLYSTTTDKFTYIPSDLSSSKTFSPLPVKNLDSNSISIKTVDNSFVGFAKNSGGTKYILDSSGKLAPSTPSEWSSAFVTIDDTVLSNSPNSTQPINNMFTKASNNSTIYLVDGVKKHPIPSWSDFINLHSDKSSDMSTLLPTTVSSIAKGSVAVAPGSLVKSSDSSSVYVVADGFTKNPLAIFAISKDLGLGSNVRTLSNSDINDYTSGSNLTSFVRCNSKNYVGNKNKIYEVTGSIATTYGWGGVSYVSPGALTCSRLQVASAALPQFIKADGGSTIYKVSGGQKHPIGSYATYTSLGGNSSNTLQVSAYFADLITTGAAL